MESNLSNNSIKNSRNNSIDNENIIINSNGTKDNVINNFIENDRIDEVKKNETLESCEIYTMRNKVENSNMQWTAEKLKKLDSKAQLIIPSSGRNKTWEYYSCSKANMYDYIKFLYVTNNTGQPFVLAKNSNDNKYIKIDGNNRSLTILRFLKKPISINKILIDNLNDFKKNNNDEIIKDLIDIMLNSSYEQYYNIRKRKDELDKLLNEHDKKDLKYEEEEYKKSIEKLNNNEKVKLKKILINCVNYILYNQLEHKEDNLIDFREIKINVTIYENPSEEEINWIYTQLNKFPNALNLTEIYASMIWHITKFEINDKKIQAELEAHNKMYFQSKKDKNDTDIDIGNANDFEVKELNAFTFIVSLQNLIKDKYSLCDTNNKEIYNNSLLSKYDGDKDNLYLIKIYKILHKELLKVNTDIFTSKYINDFIDYVQKISVIINEVLNTIRSNNIQREHFLEKTLNFKIQRNQFTILWFLIFTLKFNSSDKMSIKKDREIKNLVRKVICYHYFMNCLDSKYSQKKDFVNHDILNCNSSGDLIKKINSIYNNENKFIENEIQKNLSKPNFNKLLNELLKTSEISNSRISSEKSRRRMKIDNFKKIMINIFCKQVLSGEHTSQIKNVDHIIPFSVTWEIDDLEDNKNDEKNSNLENKKNFEMNIDRLGNLVVIDEKFNNLRSNDHIRCIHDKISEEEIKALKIPSIEIYDKIIKHDIKSTTKKQKKTVKPKIRTISEYNTMCKEREDYMKEKVLNFIMAN